MWLVHNTTPFAAERTWVQDKDANKHWLVVVKATFHVQADGSCRLSPEQVPVFRMGEPSGERGNSSLTYDADLSGVKPCTDVLLRGSAWAPNRGRAGVVDVKMSVGAIDKRLRVFGERYWDHGKMGGATISSPKPFESMSITYERAYGGWDRSAPDPLDHRLEDRNPVGTGYAIQVDGCIGKQLPNVENPSHLIESWNDRPPPAGLNAIDCSWSPRRELAGTYDANWQQNRFPLWAEDFDEHYNNCAPLDQQADGFLSGGELVQLTNLSPGGTLSFNLPRIQLALRTRFGSERVEHTGQLCTVILEPDVSRVIMVWQSSLVCNSRMDDLDETVVRESSDLMRSSR
jgi:hypothetical protein